MTWMSRGRQKLEAKISQLPDNPPGLVLQKGKPCCITWEGIELGAPSKENQRLVGSSLCGAT